MTKGLARSGVDVSFVLPKMFPGAQYDWMNVHDASASAFDNLGEELFSDETCMQYLTRHQCALVRGYLPNLSSRSETFCSECFHRINKGDDLSHISLYSRGVFEVAKRLNFEAVHGHDWMTYHAAVLARKVAAARGKRVPFIAHVHATEIDRHDGQRIYNIEKQGMQAADRVVAVSNYTKSMVIKHYGVSADKISVVHNGIEPRTIRRYPRHVLKRRYKLVLFIGRITYQKGPDYYVRVAKKVTDQYKNVKFLMIGAGDMQAAMVEMAARERLTGKLLFSSWLKDDQMDAAYQLADVFVMPSVSEPFGIVPLEAIQNGTPVVVSKNAGVIEVVRNCIPVDFWDIDKMSSAIVALLQNERFARTMVTRAQEEVRGLTWDLAASKLVDVYRDSAQEVAHA
jgi:glycosyltransferase involved in cell wall biosynthesis